MKVLHRGQRLVEGTGLTYLAKPDAGGDLDAPALIAAKGLARPA
jgi:hypothetical protein